LLRLKEGYLIPKRETRIKPDDKELSKLFIEKAREIGADEENSFADELIGRLAKKAPEPHIKGKERKTW
jgi:hypothetical protein